MKSTMPAAAFSPLHGRAGLRFVVVVVSASTGACSERPVDPAFPPSPAELVERYGLEPTPAMVYPSDNLPDAARIELGRLLFFDPIQSGGGDVACGTCHLPRFGFTDGRDLPAGPSGVGLGPDRVLQDPAMPVEGRNSPTIINAGFNRFGAETTPDGFLFWDGRKRRLENLVTLPQLELSEMRGRHYRIEDALDTVVLRLRTIPEYDALFRTAFPARAAEMDRGERAFVIDSTTLSMALAQFVRSVQSTLSPYDRFIAGDATALTPAQIRGLELFNGRAGCVRCHSGPLFSDFLFHVVGARQRGPGFQGTPHDDLGRWVVTRLDSDRYRFRTPSLRNVAETGPYTHSGAYTTLREAVEFFARGGGDHPWVERERIEIAALGLSDDENDDIVAFLEALTDLPDVDAPERVPSGLDPPR